MKKGQTFLRDSLGNICCVFILFLVIVSFPIYAANVISTGWISLGGAPGEGAIISASRAQSSGMSISFTLSGFTSAKVRHNNENWLSISFSNQCVTDVIGAPALPLLRRYFAIPRNATVKVEITDVVFETFENVKIEPFQRLLLETETAEDREFAINEKLYKTDRFYPEEWAISTESVIMHGVRMGILKINPFRYNPVTGKVQAASKITCRVTYTNPNPGVGLTFPSHLKNTFKALLLNFDFMEYHKIPSKSKGNLRQATDYLIISDPELISNAGLQSLITLYTGQGYTVELKDVSEIGSSSSDIKDYIQSLYDEGELDYVLLVGDLPAIPHNSSVRAEGDSWYTWLDGGDKIGDIGLGRMPATDETELNYMVTKTLNFQTGVEPGEWRKKSVLIAHKEDYPGKYTGCKNDIFEHEYTLEAPVMDKCYGGEGATNDDVTDAINEGRLVVNYRGHGSSTAWTGWCGSSYSTSHATKLTNGKKTPIVYMMACTNGKISSSSHCLAEAFMCQEQGAVWVLAATTTSLTKVNHHYDRGLYYGAWDEGIETVSDLRNYADAHALEESGSSANSNITMYVCFGDPLINILNISNIPYIATTSPVSGAEIEMGFKFNITWGDNISGNVKIELLKAGNVASEIASSIESNGFFEWDVPGDLTVGSDYKIRVTSIDSSALFAETNGNFSIIEEYIITEYPHIQNFDDLDTTTSVLPKKWEQLSDEDLQWTVWTGKAPTKYEDQGAATGPDGDNTSGSGNYIYVESSGGNNPSKKAGFITSKFNLKYLSDPKLTFYYHMFSDNEGTDEMGDLYLDICVDGTWKNDVFHMSKNQGDKWIFQEVPLTDYQGERVIFRFRAITGTGWGSDICLDDIKIVGNPTSIIKLTAKLPSSYNLRYYGSTLQYQVSGTIHDFYPVNIKLYNMQGKVIKTLVNGSVKAGFYSMKLDSKQQTLAKGMYQCRLVGKGYVKTINIVIIR